MSIFLAVLILGSAAAFADNAEVISFYSPYVYILTSGEEVEIPLDDLSVNFAASELDGQSALRLSIENGETVLTNVFAKLDGDRFIFTADGMSNAYSVTVPASIDPADATTTLNLSEEQLAELMEKILTSVEIEQTDNTTHFTMDYTAMNQLLATLAEVVISAAPEESLEVEGMDTESLLTELQGLRDATSGFNLDGTFTAGEEGVFLLEASLFPVTEGVAAETAFAALTTGVDEAGEFSLVLEAEELGQLFFYLTPDEDNWIVDLGMAVAEDIYELTFYVTSYEYDVEFADLPDAGEALAYESLTEAEQEQFINELTAAFGPVIEYFGSLMSTAETE